MARRVFQGRIVDPVSGDPLTIEDMLEAYRQREGDGSVGQADETVVSMHASSDIVSKHASVGYNNEGVLLSPVSE